MMDPKSLEEVLNRHNCCAKESYDEKRGLYYWDLKTLEGEMLIEITGWMERPNAAVSISEEIPLELLVTALDWFDDWLRQGRDYRYTPRTHDEVLRGLAEEGFSVGRVEDRLILSDADQRGIISFDSDGRIVTPRGEVAIELLHQFINVINTRQNDPECPPERASTPI